jgi:large subunit ribosomal protein L29
MELAKIRGLSDTELAHQEKISAEQLFRLRFQVSMGQNDGVKKLRQLRKEIAQIKTVARERELGIQGEVKETAPAARVEAVKPEEPAPVEEIKAVESEEASPVAKAKTRKTTKKAAPAAEKKAEKKTVKAKGARK